MKRTHKTLRPLAALAGLALTATSAHADVIYQDNFDNDGLATNTGIGGGAAFIDTTPSTDPSRLGSWGDDGNLTSTDAGGGWGGSSANAYSLNGFDLQNGFTLEVTYNLVNVETRLTIGLVDEAGAALDGSGLATSGVAPYGIVFNPAAHDNGTKKNGWQNRYPNAPGLQFSDGTNATQQLSDEQTRSGGIHTLVLQMDADSNWSYSVDGAVPTTGTIGGAGFDLTRDYRFFVRNQQSSIANNIQSVTLSTTGGGNAPKITSITSVGGTTWELTLEGEADTGYEFRSSTTLDFTPGTLVESLTEVGPGVVTDGNLLTTDSEGNATVRMTLTGDPADFVRAVAVE